MLVKNKIKLVTSIIGVFLIFNMHLKVEAQDISILQMYNSASRILHDGINEGNIEKVQQALVMLHKGLDLNPHYFEVLKNLAVTYFMLGDLVLACEYTSAGLRQNSEDMQLVMLDIFLDLTENDINTAQPKIEKMKSKYPFSIEILYLEMIYISLLNDRPKIDQLFLEMTKKFGKDNEYVYIYTIIKSLQDGNPTFEQDSIVNKLYNMYPNYPWILWLLSDYYIMLEQTDESSFIINKLKESKISLLEKYAYERSFLSTFNAKDFESAVKIATEYTEKYPSEKKSWEYLGIVYYVLKRYQYAERSFARAREIDSDDFLLSFMYDTVLKEGGDVLEQVRKERTEAIEVEIEYAMNSGNINYAKTLIKEELYINPLLIFPKRMLVRIYEQEGDFYRAKLELERLIGRGHQEENMEELLSYYEGEVDIDIKYLDDFNPAPHSTTKIWEMELEINSQEKDEYINELYDEFLTTLFMYNFNASPNISWKHADSDSSVKYIFEVQFTDRVGSTIVTATIKDKITKAKIYSFNRIYSRSANYDRMVNDIRTTIDRMMPKVGDIVFYDSVQSDIVVNTFQVEGIEEGKSYALYPNKNSYNFHLTRAGNHFYEDAPPLGKITIKQVSPQFSLGQIEKNDEVSTEEYLRLIQNVRKGDFILIPPQPWDVIAEENSIIRNIKSQADESIMSYYFKHLYITSLFLPNDVE